MRIGLIAGPWIPVPPPKYGGSEAVIDNLARGLQDLGHQVELFTVGDSTCEVTRSWLFPHPVTPIGNSLQESVHVEAAYRSLGSVDVIHDHTTVGPMFGARLAPAGVPVVTTSHGPLNEAARQMYTRLPSNVSLVAISHPQAASAPDVDFTEVIPHGIDVGRHRPGPGGGGYAAFVGRMNPDKGPDRAITVAREAGLPLLMMVKMRETEEVAYFESNVKPLLGDDVEIRFEPDEAERVELLGRAEMLVNPIMWPEPFGLVMAEALACATPVVAMPNGAASEIVEDGRTGFLRDDLAGMAEACRRIGEIDREACREAAVRRFSLERMVADHVDLYRRLIARSRVPRSVLNGIGAFTRSGPALPR